MPKNKEVPVRIVITMTTQGIDVTFSDWLKLNPAKMDRIRVMMGKAWRMERAKVVHADRVKKSEQTKLATQLKAEQEAV